MGQLIGAVVYENLGFRWQCDIFNICVILGFIAILVLDPKPVEESKEVQESADTKEEERREEKLID